MNRTIGGIPVLYWFVGLAAGIGAFAWIKKRGAAASGSSPATAKAGQPAPFTQAQEVQDFQIFSALTSAQQGSDLNFLTEVAGLFSGGQSTGTAGGGSVTGSGGGGTVAPAPPATGTAPPSTKITYGAPGQSGTTTFGAPPPPGTGYVWNGTQWVVDPGQGVGFVPVPG